MASNKYHLDFRVNSTEATRILRNYIKNADTPHQLRPIRDRYCTMSDIKRRISDFPMRTRVKILLPLIRSKIIVPYTVQYEPTQYKPDRYLTYDLQALSTHFKTEVASRDSLYDNIRFRYASSRFQRMLASFMSKNDITSHDEAILTSIMYTQDRSALVEDRHFDITSKGVMTYTPKHKPTIITGNGNWAIKGRQSIKYGKGLRKFMGQYSKLLPDNIYEKYHNWVYSEFNFTHELRLVSGDDIRTFYHHINQNAEIRPLDNSCMKHNRCQPYLDIYVNSPNVQLLVALNKDEVVQGRALIFNDVTDDYDNKYTVMERIYTDDKYISAFKEYAKENGWLYKSRQTYDREPFVAPNGSQIHQRLTLTLNNATNNLYPYMDSFKYTEDLHSDTITLNTSDGHLSLTNTDGSVSGQDTVLDYYGNEIERDTACWSSFTDNYYHEHDCNWSDHHETYIPYDDSVYIESQSDYRHCDDDDIVHDESTGSYELIDELYHCEYLNCYASETVECILHGRIPEHKSQSFIHNDVKYYYSDDYSPQDLITYCKDIYVDIVTAALPEAAQHLIDNPNIRANNNTNQNT